MTRIPAAQREPLAIAVALQPNLPSPWLALLRKGCVSVAPLCTPPHAPRLLLPPPLPRRDALPPEEKEALIPGFSLAAPGRRRARFPRVLASAAALVNSGSLSTLLCVEMNLHHGLKMARLAKFGERAATAACS